MNRPDSRPSLRAWLAWGLLAAALEAAFWRLATLSESFEYGERFTERPIPTVVVWLVVACVLYAVASLLARWRAPPLALVVLASIVFRLTLLPSRPIQEDDFYRYLWDGKVAASGVDPYRFSPREIELFELEAERVGDPDERAVLSRLLKLRDASSANGTIFERVNHPHLTTIYPVAAQLVFAAVGLTTPDRWTIDQQVIALKSAVTIFDVGTLIALILLLRAVGSPPSLSFLYGWCPLVVKEFAGSGHVDSVACFALVLALLGAVRSSTVLTVAGAAAAILAKFYALATLPLVLLLYWRARSERASGRPEGCDSRRLQGALWTAGGALSIVTLVAGAQLVYWRSFASRVEVLSTFLSTWENHDALFLWLRGACEWVAGVDGGIGTRMARGIAGGLLVALLIYHVAAELSRRRSGAGTTRHDDARRLLWRVFSVLAALFLLSPVGFPWYFTWCLPLLPFAQQRAWVILPGLLQVYYLRFWVDYRYPAGAEGVEVSPQLEFFDTWIVSLEFGVFFGVWIAEWAIGRAIARRERARTRPRDLPK